MICGGMLDMLIMELTRVVNECKRLVRGMERLKGPINQWDTPLTSMVRWKLHSKLLIAWEQFSADEKTDTYEMMMNFCERQIKMLISTALHHGNSILTKPVTQGSSFLRQAVHRGWTPRTAEKTLKRHLVHG